MPQGVSLGKEPELLTTRCENCGKLIEFRREAATGKFTAKISKSS